MKNLHTRILILIIAISVLSCNSKNKIERENEPTIYGVQSDDAEMNMAIETAKKTLDSFDYAVKNNSRVFTYFGLKKRFVENETAEHIWVDYVSVENGKYIGVVNNLPEKIKGIKVGDTVEINKNEVSDWMFVKGSKLHGGYTIRLLRNRMTESERENFDKESGLIITE
ncbi:DUF2314 domain-containing protein [Flavobacterium sp. J49]|uniref:YegJ family protein n=1 Tax=Flavobacterium sp. J49 TaxID=2718534 RepID=UPI001593B10C|nr:DUF2314 domain-containing protein [Flavobacterium sp. J49]MBF6640971.1 DUF2314 domain-containing protein [Flavobacterium sp. J49]NIC02218.1 DUF2314 domain-containing protein [Flavobacterium sp. J49]